MWRRIVLLVSVFAALLLSGITVLAQDTPGDAPADQGQGMPIPVSFDLLERASAESENGDYEQAIKDYSLFIFLNPTWSFGYYQRGQLYATLSDFDHALEDYTQAIAYADYSPELQSDILVSRGMIYILTDELGAALVDLNAALEANPDSPEAYFRRGYVHLINGDFADSVADYDRLIELVPEFPNAYAGRAAAHDGLGNLEAALADYDSLINLQPENATAYGERASLRANQEDFTGALSDLDNAIRLQPAQPGYYLQRGWVNNNLNNRADAAVDYLEWMRSQRTEAQGIEQFRPGESLVVPMSQGMIYALPFEGRMGQMITVSAISRPDAPTDPLIVLLDPDQTPVVADDDGADDDFSAQIDGYVIPADGTYTLLVSHAGGSPDGAVRVLLEIE